MKTLTKEERFDRLDSLIAMGRIVRGYWAIDSGREIQWDLTDRVCLLAALAPECAEQESASACPADLIPRWWAHIAPVLDDCVSGRDWQYFIERWAKLTRHAAFNWDDAKWRLFHNRVRHVIALTHVEVNKDDTLADVFLPLLLLDPPLSDDALTSCGHGENNVFSHMFSRIPGATADAIVWVADYCIRIEDRNRTYDAQFKAILDTMEKMQ